MKHTKKLIEVALPLDAINAASAREKSIRHGHPSTLHLWWARRPLAAARAVIFAQMVDDPSEYTDQLLSDPKLKRKAESELKRRLKRHETADKLGEETEAPEELALEACVADQERERLFRLIEELVKWENTTNETVIQQARDEIWASWRRTCAANADHPQAKELFDRHKLPAFHDPFAGGGALPLEAQRLGLEAWASDLNPVAVLINKAMIEIPPKFAGMEPVNPDWQQKSDAEKMGRQWKGAQGLADDVRYYGQWMRDEAEKRIGHLYPKVKITAEMVAERPDLKPYLNRELTVIAWIWARTVKSPNPAFSHVDVPLASTFMLSTKKGKEAWVEPVIEGDSYRFAVKVGKPRDPAAAKAGTSAGKRAGFVCLLSGVPMTYNYIREQGQAGMLGAKLMAIVLEGDRGRVYLDPFEEAECIAKSAKPEWSPDVQLHGKCRVNVSNYGMDVYGDLFTLRQLVALNTFSDLVAEARKRITQDAIQAELPNDDVPLEKGGKGARAYAEAVSVYLGFAVDKTADRNSTICAWASLREHARNTFGRQAIPMVWDYAESNPLSESSGNFYGGVTSIVKALVAIQSVMIGFAQQADAQTQKISFERIVSTDPPYYDNIGYADLSDFFYVWSRHNLKSVFSDIFNTMAVPKAEELIATPYRHGSKEQAEEFFLKGMTRAMQQTAMHAHPAHPITIYYAFKQSERKGDGGDVSSGWETFLAAVIKSGLTITGTWPMRTELDRRLVGSGSNALASSIILVCNTRKGKLRTTSRKAFAAELRQEIPPAICKL